MQTVEQIKQYTSLWRETNALYEEWAKQHGCSYSELLVILSIFELEENCTQKNICEHWQFPKQTVNSILKTFLKKNWIVLQLSQQDRRNKVILLTSEGRTVLESIVEAYQKFEEKVWKRMGVKHSDELMKLTQSYNDLFKEVLHEPA